MCMENRTARAAFTAVQNVLKVGSSLLKLSGHEKKAYRIHLHRKRPIRPSHQTKSSQSSKRNAQKRLQGYDIVPTDNTDRATSFSRIQPETCWTKDGDMREEAKK
jgi:hypothetical protein